MSEPAVRPAPAKARTGRHTWAAALFVAGIVALAFNLRGAITSLPPVFPELASALHLSSLKVALLAATQAWRPVRASAGAGRTAGSDISGHVTALTGRRAIGPWPAGWQ